MPDLRSTVQKMVAAGESEEDIAAVIKKLKGQGSETEIKSGLPDMSPDLAPRPRDTSGEADTFAGGVLKSLGSGEAFKAGWEGLKGNFESIKDIPANLAYGAKDWLDFQLNPGQTALRMGESLKQIPDIVRNAGNEPRTFGRTLGAFTTAPLVTEGLGAAALRGPGAINRIPRVNKTLSSIGSTLEGTRNPNYVPSTSRGLVAGAVRGVARPIGRALSRVGERGRLDAGTRPPSSKTNIKLKGETETPHSPDSDIFAGGGQGVTRPRIVRHDTPDLSRNSEFTRPILETAEELAARRGTSAFTGGQSSRNRSTPFEPRPADTTPYPVPGERPVGIPPEPPAIPIPPKAPPGTNLVKDKVPSIEDQFAAAVEAARLKMAQDPSVELPPPPYSHGAPQPPEQPRVSVAAPKSPKEVASKAPKKPNTPAGTPPPTNPSAFTFEDLQMMKTRRDEVNAILRKMAEENDVDPTTGEISSSQVDRTFPGLPNKKRTQGKWGITRPDEGAKFADNVNEEMGYFGGEQHSGMIDDAGMPDAPQRYPGDEAYDLGEISPGFRQTPSMPNWGPETINSPRPVNPLRPEVPPGQVTNRSMFERSELRGLENRQAGQNSAGKQFAESVGHEFDQDMMLTPDEFRQPDVPEFTSPFENQNDPRISGLAPRPDAPEMRTIAPEEWGDWGGLEADIPTLVPDASGSHVAAPRKSQFSAKANEEAGFSGPKRIADTADDSGRARDVRWDAETESYFDRNTRNWDDVIDATPEEIARARGINKGEILDPTGPTPRYGTNLDITALDRTEVNKRGQGQSRLNSMFGEDTAQRLNSGESSIGPSKEGPARRELGKKQLDKSEQATWNSWGDEYLDGIPPDPNKPGLHIYDSGDLNGPLKIVYRDAQGNPIGTLETGQFNTKGIANLAVSSKVGLGRGNIAFKMLKEAIDRGITEATGPTSGMTKNLIERVKRVIKDSSTANDDGMFGSSDVELELNKIMNGEQTESIFGRTQPNERMGFSGKRDSGTANDSGQSVDMSQYDDWIEELLRDSENLSSGGLRKMGDPEKVVIPEIRMTEADIDDLRSIRHNRSVDDAMRTAFPGAKLTSKFTDIFPRYKDAEIDFVSGWNEGAASVTFKDGRTAVLGREDIDMPLSGARSDHNKSIPDYKTVMNLERFNKEGNFIPQTEPHPTAAKIAESRAKNPTHWKNPQLGDARPVTEGIFQETGHGDIFEGASDQFNRVGPREEQHGFNVDEDPGIANDDPFKGMTNNKSRLVKTPKEPNFPSVIPEGFEKVTGNKPGPAGAAYRITDPNGKHLGDINVTPKDIAEVKKMNDGVLADVPDEDLAKELYKNRLEAMLAQHGFSPDDAPRMKIDAMDNRLKKSGPTELKDGKPTFSTTKKTEEPRPLPADFGTDKLGEAVSFPNDTFAGSVGRPGLSGRGQLGAGETPKPSRFKAKAIDPDEAFARGGDIGPIVQEAAKLMFDNAVDSRFRSLLPEQMRGPLETGQTYQGKLKRLIEEIEGEYTPEQGAQRYAEMEAFNDSLRGYSRNPIDIPPLNPRSVDVSKLRPGKLNQQKPWVSPRAQQKYKRSLDDMKKNKK